MFLLLSAVRSLKVVEVNPTATLVRFVVWPLAMEEFQHLGSRPVQRAPQEKHSTVSTPGS